MTLKDPFLKIKNPCNHPQITHCKIDFTNYQFLLDGLQNHQIDTMYAFLFCLLWFVKTQHSYKINERQKNLKRFHCAAVSDIRVCADSDLLNKVNVAGTQNILNACRVTGVKRLIYTSSTDGIFVFFLLLLFCCLLYFF